MITIEHYDANKHGYIDDLICDFVVTVPYHAPDSAIDLAECVAERITFDCVQQENTVDTIRFFCCHA